MIHRKTGKQGVALEELNEGTWWQADDQTATPHKAWVIARWRGEERPELVRTTELDKAS